MDKKQRIDTATKNYTERMRKGIERVERGAIDYKQFYNDARISYKNYSDQCKKIWNEVD